MQRFRDSFGSISFAQIIFEITVLIFSVVAFGFSIYNYRISKNTTVPVLSYESGAPLPSKFVISESVLSPVVDQGARGTCWIFQIIGIFEAQYKQQGLSMGYLNQTEYLALSHEALGKIMVDICMRNPVPDECKFSIRLLNTTQSGSLEEFVSFYNAFDEMKKSIYPESCCPYHLEPDDEMKCPDLDKCKNNPLDFDIIRAFHTTNIRDAKQRLIETNIPLAASISMPQQRYWFHCENQISKDSETAEVFSTACNSNALTDHYWGCPNDPSSKCTPVDFKIYKLSQTEHIYHNPGKTVAGTGHAMLLVGYNDNFVAKRISNFTMKENVVGGFIFRNSWGWKGHSLEYLLGNINEDQEGRICPNKDDVFRWVPLPQSCLGLRTIDGETTSSLDSNECKVEISNSKKIIRGNKSVSVYDELNCVNKTHCDLNKKYTLIQSNNGPFPDFIFNDLGMPMAKIGIVETKTINGKEVKYIKEDVLDSLPLQHVYYAFQLQDPPQDTPGRCGFIFFPYETAEEEIRSGDGVGSPFFSVQGIQVNWSKSSYAKSKMKKDYSEVKKSMRTYNMIKAKSPFDFSFDL